MATKRAVRDWAARVRAKVQGRKRPKDGGGQGRGGVFGGGGHGTTVGGIGGMPGGGRRKP